MEPTNCPISRNVPLKRLVTNAMGEIERLGYSRRSRNRYRAIWEYLIEFSDQNEPRDEFSGDLVVRFLEECRVGDEKMERPAQGWRKHIVWGVKVLADFAKTGRIERAFADVDAIHLVSAMQNTLRDYVEYCNDRLHLRPGTLYVRTRELTILLDFLYSKKARTLDQIQARDLSEFLSCRADLPLLGKIRRDHGLQPRTVARIVSDMRSFLRFLAMRGILQKDLSVELPKQYPSDTLLQRLELPSVRASVELSRKNPTGALRALQGVSYELGGGPHLPPAMYPVYIRGEAYLALRQGKEAAAEFQKFLDHRSIVLNEPIGALAHLGIGRAYALQGDTVKARAAYQDFLALWKDADPDIPILKQAKAEYAKLK